MPVQDTGEKLTNFCNDGASVTREGADGKSGENIGAVTSLSEYMHANSQWYNDINYGVAERDNDKDVTKCAPNSALKIWELIATEIAELMYEDRNVKSVPKHTSDLAIKFKGVPSALLLAVNPAGPTEIPPGAPSPADGTAKAEIDSGKKDKIKDTIIKWFHKNYTDAVLDGKVPSRKGGPDGEIEPFDTDPYSNGKAVKDVEDAFNKFWVKCTFTPVPGIPLPPALTPDNASPPQEYFPNLAPAKDAEGNESSVDADGNKVLKGAAGFIYGPYDRNVQYIEIDGEVTLSDGPRKTKQPKYELVVAPLDPDEYWVDNEFNNTKDPVSGKIPLKEELGSSQYATFVKNRGDGPTGLPIDGGKEYIIEIPGEEGEPPEKINTGIFGLGTNGKMGGMGSNGASKPNPNFGKPLDPLVSGYGIPSYGNLPLLHVWKYEDNTKVIDADIGKDKGTTWGGTATNTRFIKTDLYESPPQCWQSTAKGPSSTEAENGEKELSYSDPRTWGPWIEYAKESDEANRFKYLVPDKTAFSAMLSAPNNGNAAPGVRLEGLECAPVLNKSYWGYRIREVFSGNAAQAVGAAREAASKGQPNSGTVVINSTKAIAGPVPPLVIQEKNGSYKFTWKNSDVLLKGGKVDRNDGREWDRTGNNPNSPGEFYNTIGRHINHSSNGVIPKLDKKVKGTLSGGMVYWEPTKQILAPYTPPPLKPFLPNSENKDWG